MALPETSFDLIMSCGTCYNSFKNVLILSNPKSSCNYANSVMGNWEGDKGDNDTRGDFLVRTFLFKITIFAAVADLSNCNDSGII